jgi:nucleoside-diphosphate-sugar epimerase
MSGRVLITGASGFIGRTAVRMLAGAGWTVRAALRAGATLDADVEKVIVGDLSHDTDWSEALKSVDAVLHLAARVHVMKDKAKDPLAEYRRVNVAGTACLARQAATAGVRRFVFMSSIKVNGERTFEGKPFRASDSPAPIDHYGVSKLEAERELAAIGAASTMQICSIRPVLVYGPGVKGNFASLMRVLAKGVPLPLGGINNRRSLVSVTNLIDLARTCLSDPRAAGQTFLVSDGVDLSTTDLLLRLGEALDRRARLVVAPLPLLRGAASLLGKDEIVSRLCDSLQVDISATCKRLDWSPPQDLPDGLRAAARAAAGR